MLRPSRLFVMLVGAALFAAVPVAGAGASTLAGGNDKPEAIATLKIENPKVEVKKKGADDFKAAKDGQELRVGDTVRTDAAGLAEVDYDADTYTRLDVNTTFKIVKLTDEQGNRQVEGTVEGGQTWNRTSALTESETFKQTGAGATAAVTGTAYAAQCNADATHCDWIGIVDAFTLTGKDGVQKLVSPLDKCDSTVGVLCADLTHLDPSQLGDWILENIGKDVAERGLPLPDFLRNATIVFDDTTGEVFLVPASEGSTPPAPPTIDTVNPVDITNADESPGTTTGPNPKVVSQDENDAVTFALRVTAPDGGTYYIVFTDLPSGAFGQILQGSTPVDTLTHYAPDTVFTFDPVEIEPDCNSEPETFSDCFTNGFPNGGESSSPYPGTTPGTDGTNVIDNGNGTVSWYDTFTFTAVSDQGAESAPETVTLESQEDLCNPGGEGSRTANDVVPSCNEST